MNAEFSAVTAARPDWSRIDWVLLDMDGTLLDLNFDNYFWLELVPERYAHRHGITVAEAKQRLTPQFAAKQGTLDWYCTDYWTRELQIDIAELKREVSDRVRFLHGAEEFLAHLRQRSARIALVTNAHHNSLSVKAQQTGLLRFFDAVVSSHRFGAPKEHLRFWEHLQKELGFDPARCLFIDDSVSVLRAARDFGIGQIYAVSRPDSAGPVRKITEFEFIEAVHHLLD
ncbi:MAG TPA: GMP/IMP nucleotidase [Steroidobacteraceae bacterium]|nr:GMP/IMP nucleotidase [Steroidobacteraceae bacterium]